MLSYIVLFGALLCYIVLFCVIQSYLKLCCVFMCYDVKHRVAVVKSTDHLTMNQDDGHVDVSADMDGVILVVRDF